MQVSIGEKPAFEVISLSKIETSSFLLDGLLVSTSAEPGPVEAKEAPPALSNLRVSMERVNTGMSDFIIQLATPSYDNMERSGTVIGIRGSRALCKADKVKELASVIAGELKKRNDKTYDWARVNVDHLASMLIPHLKYFAAAPNVLSLNFVTDAVL